MSELRLQRHHLLVDLAAKLLQVVPRQPYHLLGDVQLDTVEWEEGEGEGEGNGGREAFRKRIKSFRACHPLH